LPLYLIFFNISDMKEASMRHRRHLPEQERTARSKLTKLLHDEPFVAGGLVKMARTCGKANCKCTRGEKHVSWYLATRYKNARKMINIPRHWETDVFEWVKTYKEIMKQTDIISQHCLERFMISSKEGGAKDS
jgi:hypothetical protein